MAIELGGSGEVGAYGDLVDEGPHDFKVAQIGDGVSGEAVLPERELRVEAVGEAVLDEFDGLVERHALRREQQMNVVGHDDIGMQLVVTNGAVVQQSVNEQLGDARDLKHRAAIACRQGDKRNAGSGWPRRFRHKNLNGKEAMRARVSHEWGVRGGLWRLSEERERTQV